jgi:hypothetical protein
MAQLILWKDIPLYVAIANLQPMCITYAESERGDAGEVSSRFSRR